MKKFYLIAMMALATMSVNAQQKVILSTYAGTPVEKFDGCECNVTVNRYVFTGWNTISLPFAVSESELNELFGADCRLEKLVGAEQESNGIRLDFQDCKSAGIEANVPYILHYTGEAANKKISKLTTLTAGEAALTYQVKGGNETVTMACAQTHIDGIGFYGVLAVDNAEARFTPVDETKSGFYATRCYVKVSSGTDALLRTNHLAAGELSSISAVASSKEKVDVYTLSGVKVATNVRASEINKMHPGVYVVNGQKVLVK